ncbi:MAG TPA: DUF5985 family protein [Longimicrobiaceae bacterium]|nr:DUF5985 family protein [Longimicrobiaceae bacterium]
MATLVYALCALTSLLCTVLLARGYLHTRARLLLWAALCFGGLALNNVLLFVDEAAVPSMDLSVWRSLPALAGVVLLVYGLVWDTR